MGSERGAARGLTFFFDRSTGKAVPTALRTVGVPVEIHDELYGVRIVPDEEWMRAATAKQEILVTRDRKIRSRPAERELAIAVGARMFVLGGNAGRLDMLRSLMIAWNPIHVICAAEAPPFIYTIHDSGRLSAVHPEVSRPARRAGRRKP